MLEQNLFRVTIVATVEDAIVDLEIAEYDAVILDWMLPDAEGTELIHNLRQAQRTTPVLMLTARSQTEDVVEGLNAGADDYLTKPFAMRELLARLQALIRRRGTAPPSSMIHLDNLTINTNTCMVERGGKRIVLAPREYALLEYLARNMGTVVDRTTLLHHVWGEDVDLFSNTVDVHIRYLRKKIDQPYKKKLIHTVKQKGYVLCEDFRKKRA